jgi:hypothetical protein
MLEYLFEELESFLDLALIEAVEGHDRVLSDHVAEGDKS